MADKKISALTGASTPLAGTEVLPIVQGGATVKVSVENLTLGRTVEANNFVATGLVVAGTDFKVASNVGYGVKASDNSRIIEYYTSYVGFNVPIAVAGNITPTTAAKGVNFTANTPAAGMTSQLLNWYEEGAFTPVIADAATGGNAGTAEFTFARYTRIGRKIFFNINLVNVDTSGLTAGNTLFLRGLPFTAGNWCNGFSNTAAVTNFTYAGTMINAEVYAGGTYIRFYDVKSATGATLLTVAAISSGSCNIYINGMYEV